MLRRTGLVGLPLASLAVMALALPTAAASGVSYDPILSGYDLPMRVTYAGAGSREIFVIEQGGKIKRATFRGGAWRKLGTFLDISDRVSHLNGDDQIGILGAAFHPDFRKNGRFYVAYTRDPPEGGVLDSVVAEFQRVSHSRANPASERILMVIEQRRIFHHVANLAFGPDGLLYIGSGDGGPNGDPFGNAQNLESPLGKILRIDPLDPDQGGPERFSIPKNNPYVGKPGRDTIWSSGLRNPWGFSFDRMNGDLWIGDVGNGRREEVDRSTANKRGREAGRGLDYGWNDCEGSLEFEAGEGDADDVCEHDTLPLYDYGHGGANGGCAVIGGYVYRGPNAGSWHGLYFAADLCGRLFVLDQQGRVRFQKETPRQIVSFGEDASGRIFAIDRAAGEILLLKLSGRAPPP